MLYYLCNYFLLILFYVCNIYKCDAFYSMYGTYISVMLSILCVQHILKPDYSRLPVVLYYVTFLANLHSMILIKYLLYGKQPWPRGRLRLILLHPLARGP